LIGLLALFLAELLSAESERRVCKRAGAATKILALPARRTENSKFVLGQGPIKVGK
jgi:hypothetical protein